MRYTTIIDITEEPAVYHNIHCRLLYLHMTLRAGYHDDDRDIYRGSIRSLAAQVGMTLSATRHALSVLIRAKLLEQVPMGWRVTKWVLNPAITARPKNRKEQADKNALTALSERFEKEVQDGLRRREIEQQKQELERRKWAEEGDHTEFIRQYEMLLEKEKKSRLTIQESIYVGQNRKKYEAVKAEQTTKTTEQ